MTRWQIFSAVALRKLPELLPRKDPIEQRVQDIFSAWEVASSRLSKHELQHLEDLRAKDSTDLDVAITETAQDKEDRWVKEKSEFQYGTYDDRLSKIQYLFIKQKYANESEGRWLLPQTIYDSKQDESLLDTARRALLESLNIFNGFRIVSKIPSAVYTYRYPKNIAKTTGHDGAKVFFLKAHLDIPSPTVLEAVDESKHSDKLRWLTRNEALKLIDEKYMRSFSQGLLHENRVNTDQVLKRASGYASAIRSAEQQKMSQI